MSSNLQFGRPQRRRWRSVLFLLILVLLIAGGVAWERGWLPEESTAAIEQNVSQYAPQAWQTLAPEALQEQLPAAGPLSTLSEPVPVNAEEGVVQASSEVLENPESDAYTAALYEPGEQEIPWANAGGRTKVITYTVQSGDTLWSIATRFELDLDTLRWSNEELERNPDVLSVGTILNIIPVQGAYHTVETGDTLEAIAAEYAVSVDAITEYPPNGMYRPYELEPGMNLIIPFGNKERAFPKPSISDDYALAWPIVSPVTGTFSPGHPAIDIGAPYGTAIYAAHGGIVSVSDWSENYGYRVILSHGDNFQTWYTHMSSTPLTVGLAVPRGTFVGEVGSTGRSTGPHLHFEVHIDGEPVDPLPLLPPEPQ